jgi:tripartite ATP-independent transporter DctM subunit
MDPAVLSLGVFALLFILLALGMPLGFAMMVPAFLGLLLLLDLRAALSLLGNTTYETGKTYDLSVLPMFLIMGQIASSAGLSEKMYRCANAWLCHRRGGLAQSTVAGSAIFAAICGSNIATTVTMCKVSLPQMRKANYDLGFATGAIAGGGTLGILIPPSTLAVLYGILTDTSIIDVLMAGTIPGIILTLLYMVSITLKARLHPELAPTSPRADWTERWYATLGALPSFSLILIIIGGLYFGIFSPTEGASVGACGALILAVANGSYSWSALMNDLVETTKLTAIIFTILIGAFLFNNFLVIAGIPTIVAGWFAGLPFGKLGVLVLIIVIYIFLGAVMDELAMVLLTLPIFFPILMKLGYDPVWFGIVLTVLVEMGMICPPVGILVFVIKGMTPDVPIERIYAGIFPYLYSCVILIALLIIWPDIALWLPSTMR